MTAAENQMPFFWFGGSGDDNFTLAGQETRGVGLGGNDQITGTDGDNLLVGDFFALDYFNSFNSTGVQIAPLPAYDLTQRGNDILYGGGLDDTLVDDQGNDRLFWRNRG